MKRKPRIARIFRDGQHVKLRACEGNPTEWGHILGDGPAINGVVVIKLDRAYRSGPYDDGIREVPIEQVTGGVKP